MLAYLILGAVVISVLVGCAYGLRSLKSGSAFLPLKPIWYTTVAGTIAWIVLVFVLEFLTRVWPQIEELVPPVVFLLYAPIIAAIMAVFGLIFALPVSLVIRRFKK